MAERWESVTARLRSRDIPDRIKTSEARSGELTLQVDGRYIHSSYEPRQEAAKRVGNAGIGPDGPVIVLGVGLGYHVEELLRTTSAAVLVIESDEDVAAAAVQRLDVTDADTDRCLFYVGRIPADVVGDRTFKDAVAAGADVHRLHPLYHLDRDYYAQIENAVNRPVPKMPDQLRVFVVGPVYGGSVPVARYTASAFKRLGHHVEFMDCSVYEDTFETIKTNVKSGNRAGQLESMFVSFLAEMAVVRAVEFGAHLVFALAQAPLHEGAVRKLKDHDILTAFWFVENYRQLDYWRRIAPVYDFFFTIQAGEFLDKLAAIGVENCACVHTGCDPDIHRPLYLDDDDRDVFSSDISFAGAAYHNRLVTFESLADKDFRLWGVNWIMSPLLAPLVQNEGRTFTTDEMIKVFAGSKISLNLHSSNQSECIDPEGDFFNPRLFELAASGAFQITDERAGLDTLFEPGSEIVTFRNAVDLREKVDYFLEHEDERREIAERARSRALHDHTYDQRLKEILAFIAEWAGDRLADRPDEHFWTANEAAKRPETPDGLKSFLNGCPSDVPCTLDGLLPEIGSGDEGPQELSEPEGMLLLLHEALAHSKIE